MKKLSKLSKKRKVMILISSIVVVCGIAIGTMYATGVLPGQTKGYIYRVEYEGECVNPKCSCHKQVSNSIKTSNVCGHCSKCYRSRPK